MSIALPPEPAAGEPLRASWGAQMVRWCRANTLVQTPGMILSRTPNGTSCRPVGLARPGSAAPALPQAFDLTITMSDAGAATVSIYPGEAGGSVPDNVLEDFDAPTGDLSHVYVTVETDGASIQSCRIHVSSVYPDNTNPAPTQNSLPLTIDVVVGLVDYTPPVAPATVGTYTPYRTFFPPTNIRLTPIEVFRTTVDEAEPGKLPYDTWYTWQAGGT